MTTTWTENGRPLSTYEGVEYPVAAHVHAQVDITGLITGLDSKANRLSPLIQPSAVGSVGLTVQGLVDQTGNLTEFKDSAGAILSSISSIGALSGRQAAFTANAAGVIPLVVRGATGQTASFLEVQDSAGARILRQVSSGSVVIAETGTGRLHVGSLTGAQTAHGEFVLPDPARKGLVVRGAASQTANPIEVQNSAGTVLARIGANGSLAATIETLFRELQIGDPDTAGTGFRTVRVAN